MATTDAIDVLLTEDEMLAFFLSRSGEVSNSELVTHFRPVLKTGQHRTANRRQFPRFVNRLATVSLAEDGRKMLTLKKEFRRNDGPATASEHNNNDAVDAGTAAAAADAMKSDSKCDEPEEVSCQSSSIEVAAESRRDDVDEVQQAVDRQLEQSGDNCSHETAVLGASCTDSTNKTDDAPTVVAQNEDSPTTTIDSCVHESAGNASDDVEHDSVECDAGTASSPWTTVADVNSHQIETETAPQWTDMEVAETTQDAGETKQTVQDNMSPHEDTGLVVEINASRKENVVNKPAADVATETQVQADENLSTAGSDGAAGTSDGNNTDSNVGCSAESAVEQATGPVLDWQKNDIQAAGKVTSDLQVSNTDIAESGIDDVDDTGQTVNLKQQQPTDEHCGLLEQEPTNTAAVIDSTPYYGAQQREAVDCPSIVVDSIEVDDAFLSNDEPATELDVGDGLPDVLSTLMRRKKVRKTSSSSDQPTTASDQSGEKNEFRRVRELAQRIDKAASQEQAPATAAGENKQPIRGEVGGRPTGARTRDRTSQTSSTPYDFTMNETQRDWTLRASYSDYQELSKLLGRYPSLASRRDFITGFSALHWAAKNGSTDVAKLLLGSRQPPNVDARTHGGYTALHVAAINSRHHVIELLVVVYKADTDVTDFTGHKPAYYLGRDVAPGRRSSAFLRSEMLLTPKRGASSLTPKRRQMLLTRRQTSIKSGHSTPTITSLLGQTRPVTTLMLPPRDLPAVVRRRPVTTSRKPSLSECHSDSETSSLPARYQTVTPIRPSGSTSDIGTLV